MLGIRGYVYTLRQLAWTIRTVAHSLRRAHQENIGQRTPINQPIEFLGRLVFIILK